MYSRIVAVREQTMIKLFAWIGFSCLFLLIITLAIPNTQIVTLYYYAGQIEIRLTLLLLFTFSLGIILGLMTHLLLWWQLHRNNQRLKKLHQQALHELNRLAVHAQDASTQ